MRKPVRKDPVANAPAPKRVLDPFDVMRATRTLAPHDPGLNNLRWLTGESLRQLYGRADFQALRSPSLGRIRQHGFGSGDGLPASDIALHARDTIRAAEERAGPAAWPILLRVVIQGAQLRDCRGFVPELVTPWRADAVLADRLRVALDAIGPLFGTVPSAAKEKRT